MAFAAVYKTYAGSSARRLSTDLREAEDEGRIGKAPSFISLLNYLRMPEMVTTLTAMLEVSSLPMRAVET